MQGKKEHAESSLARGKVWASIVISTLGVVVSLTSALIPAVVISAERLQLSKAIVAAVGAVLVLASFTIVLARRERGTSRVATLKGELTNAYIGALENSAFNPLRGGS
jgi:uncharacterized protein YacL